MLFLFIFSYVVQWSREWCLHWHRSLRVSLAAVRSLVEFRNVILSIQLLGKGVVVSSALLMLFGVIPYLIGLLMELTIYRLMTFGAFNFPLTSQRQLLTFQRYIVGLVCFKIWHLFVTTEGVNPHWFRVWQNARRESYLNGAYLWRSLVWPLTGKLLYMLSVPYIMGYVLLPYLGILKTKATHIIVSLSLSSYHTLNSHAILLFSFGRILFKIGSYFATLYIFFFYFNNPCC
jgi:hypothetical protein